MSDEAAEAQVDPACEPVSLDRRHGLDALRAVAMLLGIGLHAALSYTTFPLWPVHDSKTHSFFDIFFFGIHGFRMHLFFMLSGFFVAMLWRKRGIGGLLKHRSKRIVLPLVVFLIPVNVAMVIAFVGTSIFERDDRESLTGVWAAARDNDTDALKTHLDQMDDLGELDPTHHLAALNWAAIGGSVDAVGLLLDRGADINARSKDEATALLQAAFMGRDEVVALLIERGAEINPVSMFRHTPMDAAELNWGIVQWIAGDLDVTVNHASFEAGRKKTIELLQEHGGMRKRDLDRTLAKTGRGGFAAWYRGATSAWWFHSPNVLAHLWFLWFLIVLILMFAFVAWLVTKLGLRGPPRWLILSPAWMIWLVPLTMIPQSLHGLDSPNFGADLSEGVVPLPHVLLLYAVFFFFGVLYYEADDAEGRLGRYWWLSLPVAMLLVFPIGASLLFMPETDWVVQMVPEDWRRTTAVFLQAWFAWLMIAGSIGLFRSIASREHRVVRYVSDSSYWLYIAHLPLLFVAQAIAKPWDVSPFVKFAFVCVSVTIVLLIVYEYVVRYTWIGTMLNGKHVRGEA